ncbi:MAG TPA: hypothetical protein VGE28_20600 [Pseudomonas sp.]
MPNLYHYRTFGLHLAFDRPLPFLAEIASASPDCIVLLHGNATLERLPPHAKQSTHVSWEWESIEGDIIIRFHDPLNQGQVEFRLQPDGQRMEAWWSPEVFLHDVIRLCTSIMMGRILHLAGRLALHANAVRLGESCILLAAPSGAGKSSTTAALLKAGAALISDDIVGIRYANDQFIAAHGFAQLRLWPDTASELLPGMTLENVYERTALTGDKRYWDLAQQPGAFYPADHPVQAIYLLGERNMGRMSAQPLPANQAIGLLLHQLYLGQPAHPAVWQKSFPALVKLAQQVPVFTLHLEEGLHSLRNAHDFLLSHLRKHTA